MAERQQTAGGGGESTLSLDPRISRIGVAHFEGVILADWDMKTIRKSGPDVRVRRWLIPTCVRLLDQHCPQVLIVPDIDGGSRRSANVRSVIEAVTEEAGTRGIVVVPVSDEKVKATFEALRVGGGRNKQKIGEVIAAWFPEVAYRRPAARRTWESERHSTPLYDAIARWCAWRGLPRRGSGDNGDSTPGTVRAGSSPSGMKRSRIGPGGGWCQ